ncbi:Tryprostatin B 6-hydroxylase [Lachnellula suecica]|uniref:Tryprostatin B 6-hydroxylase n=1 Tax=Lachnellula suecica TaxID=602035 RepID=A0A8T9CDF5_9HELO|nr:Tryprostatin B 6-hydroxylase [Lachnellula suecica]
MISQNSIWISFTAGILSHLGLFNRYEHHMYGTRYLQFFICSLALSTGKLSIYDGESINQAFTKTLLLAACYLGGVYLSLFSYRLYFTPIRNFSGPFGAKLSNLWFSLRLGKHDAHKKLLALHGKYGDFLRIGSSDLSIVHPEAVQAIYGLGSRCTKASWYDLTLPMVSMQTTRDRAIHDRRRRAWSTAFSDKALRGYEQRIQPYQDHLVSQLETFGERPVNATKWFLLYSFDVMGDLAYSKSFHMLETSEEHWAIKLLIGGVDPLAWMFPTWLFRLLVAIPLASRGWWKFIKYSCDKLDERMEAKTDIPDVMSSLLEPWKDKKPTGFDLKMLQGDSQLIIVAGSDTTAATLTCLFYELAKNPAEISKLREEILSTVGPDENIMHQQLQYLKHLNAVINETLRLHPPVGTALQRTTPREGIQIGATYIPGDITVWCPQYVIGRNENIYTKAKDFIPERWYEGSEMIKDPGSFAPFSTGTYACIGKPLALLNIRTTIARLITNFDISFAPGEDGKEVEDETKVHFTSAPGILNLQFVRR